MANLFRILTTTTDRVPQRVAVIHRQARCTYESVTLAARRVCNGVVNLGLAKFDRVAIFLDKQPELPSAIFGVSAAGMLFVPINPLLKPRQVRHILSDCGARILITTVERYRALASELGDIRLHVILCGDGERALKVGANVGHVLHHWSSLDGDAPRREVPRVIDQDPAAILYTSGSTGAPKGIVLSHRNLTAGAGSVNEYLANTEDDVILSVLPLSFDAGLSQLTTAAAAGASVVLVNYLRGSDAVDACAAHGVTAITAVPPLWMQLAAVEWPKVAAERVRLFANTGGHMPVHLLGRLRELFPRAKPYLMYGLTEAFRSTYLPPEEIDRRPTSIGKAVPNADVDVLRPDGTSCDPEEFGELVHRGAFVTLGYWNDRERTTERFRPSRSLAGVPLGDLAVWSGDVAKKDEDGFIYFVGRNDEMIKTSGYRVSPTEIEDVVYRSNLVTEAAAMGLSHSALGQAIAVAIVPLAGSFEPESLIAYCRKYLPTFMVPKAIFELSELPRNMNGKIDRKELANRYRFAFVAAADGAPPVEDRAALTPVYGDAP